jgi:hypothetical protein
MVYNLHNFFHYLLRNKFIFYVDYMVLLYLVWKFQVLGWIAWWLLLFLECDFLVIHKLGRFHSMLDALSQMPNLTKQNGVPNLTTDVTLSFWQVVWL